LVRLAASKSARRSWATWPVESAHGGRYAPVNSRPYRLEGRANGPKGIPTCTTGPGGSPGPVVSGGGTMVSVGGGVVESTGGTVSDGGTLSGGRPVESAGAVESQAPRSTVRTKVRTKRRGPVRLRLSAARSIDTRIHPKLDTGLTILRAGEGYTPAGKGTRSLMHSLALNAPNCQWRQDRAATETGPGSLGWTSGWTSGR
jgi:hypothetical protein